MLVILSPDKACVLVFVHSLKNDSSQSVHTYTSFGIYI